MCINTETRFFFSNREDLNEYVISFKKAYIEINKNKLFAWKIREINKIINIILWVKIYSHRGLCIYELLIDSNIDINECLSQLEEYDKIEIENIISIFMLELFNFSLFDTFTNLVSLSYKEFLITKQNELEAKIKQHYSNHKDMNDIQKEDNNINSIYNYLKKKLIELKIKFIS